MFTPKNIYIFEQDLKIINPDCSYEDWIRVGRAIYDATKGSDDGLAIFDQWSSQRDKYKGKKEIEAVWYSFRTGEKYPNPIDTLATMAAETMGIELEDYLQLEQTSMISSFIHGMFEESE